MKIKVLIPLILYFLFQNSVSYSQGLEEGVNFAVNFLVSEKFENIKLNKGANPAIDSLFSETVKFFNGDISEALLALTFGTLSFDEMPLSIPVINLKTAIKLPVGPPSLFNKKYNAVPGYIFFDSSPNGYGDKDKVAHFFGSAYLAYSERVLNISKFMGILVELFEESFKVQGKIDNKDIIADNLGELFGDALKENKDVKPSNALSVYLLLHTIIFLR